MRNLPLQMFEQLTPGQIVDYCIEYNNMLDVDDNENDGVRIATQADFDRF